MTKIEVIVTTMNATNHDKYFEMHLQTDAVIANQTNSTSLQTFFEKDKKIKLISTETRGVGKNRNIGLIHCNGDLINFADDDMVFSDGYEDMILNEFARNPNADAIFFSVVAKDKTSVKKKMFKKRKKIHFRDVRSLGACGLVIKKQIVDNRNLWFSTCFGGGAKYSFGEDSLFLKKLFTNKVRIYSSPEILATIKDSDSTWYRGFNEKFIHDRGVLAYNLYGNFAYFYLFAQFIKKRKRYKLIGLRKSIKILLLGIREAKQNRKGK